MDTCGRSPRTVSCAKSKARVSSLLDCRSTPTIFPHSVARHRYVSTVAAISLLLGRSTIHAPRRTGRLCLCYSTAHERRPTENSNSNRNLFVRLSTFGFVALLLLLCFAPPGGAAAPSDTLGHRLRDAAPGNAAQRKRGYVVAASVAPHRTAPHRTAPHRTAEGVVALLVH